MPDPGYGPNGQRLAVSGIIPWEANRQPVIVAEGEDVHSIQALGIASLPTIDQADDEVMSVQSGIGPIMFMVPEGQDVWSEFPLGITTIPGISQSDDEVWAHIYPGGAPIVVPSTDWLISTGFWTDSGVWVDSGTWVD